MRVFFRPPRHKKLKMEALNFKGEKKIIEQKLGKGARGSKQELISRGKQIFASCMASPLFFPSVVRH